MNTELNAPLTDAEFDRLAEFLDQCEGDNLALNLEELDGFFAALIAGPETVPPSEYLVEVFGGELPEAVGFSSLEEFKEIVGLLVRHWNTIANTLFAEDVHLPLLLEDEDGVIHGNDWATGFMLGIEMRHESWAEIFRNDEYCGWVFPMMILDHEHDEDPEMRPPAITPEKREEIFAYMAAGLVRVYRHFRQRRQNPGSPTSESEPRRAAAKVGRNEPCPCGSGKKYKKCCGGTTVN